MRQPVSGERLEKETGGGGDMDPSPAARYRARRSCSLAPHLLLLLHLLPSELGRGPLLRLQHVLDGLLLAPALRPLLLRLPELLVLFPETAKPNVTKAGVQFRRAA